MKLLPSDRSDVPYRNLARQQTSCWIAATTR
jgi:hypothetical protein